MIMEAAPRPARVRPRHTKPGLFALSACLAVLAAAAPARAADDIVLGASLPLSGPLAGFGSFQQWGYKRAVEEANKAGGIVVGGKALPVRLVLRDDKTDPNASASNVETLISRDKAAALLGSCTTPLVIAGALVAERHKVPMVTACQPLETFRAVRRWTYVWDLFFDEPDLAHAPFGVLADLELATNKKVAIFHDNGPDGKVVGGETWPAMAKQAGLEVVQVAAFPTDNTQFTSIIAEAKAKNAEIALINVVTPQAIAIRKQMAAAGYTPKFIDIERGAEPAQFAAALGKLADGVLAGGYWDPSFPFPGAAGLAKSFEAETGQSSSQHIADSYAVAVVMLDAIRAAASTSPADINAALAKTDKMTVVGPIRFDDTHTAKLPMVSMQWQGGKTVVVWPADKATGHVLFPVP